jgi:CheY-like chemotaxis protein
MSPIPLGADPRVLVVDDEEDTRALLSALLSRETSCVVLEAEGGAEALAMLRDPREPLPCLIVLDWMMPKMHGAAVLAEIRRDARLAVIPVVVFTAAPDVAAPGALRVLEKPRGLPVLIELTRELCDRERQSLASWGPGARAKTS